MTPEEFVRQVHAAMEVPDDIAKMMKPDTILIGQAISVATVLARYREELPHVSSTANLDVPLPVFKELGLGWDESAR